MSPATAPRLLRRTAIVAATVVLLLLVADVGGYASGGRSLLLGQRNRDDRVTTLTRTTPGPALRLRTAGQTRPSLRVSSSALVRRLNADRVDGYHARDLTSDALSFRAGRSGVDYTDIVVFRTPVPAGSYLVSFTALPVPTSVAPDATAPFICGVTDVSRIGQQSSGAYTGNAASAPLGVPAVTSGADAVTIGRGEVPGVICALIGQGTFRLVQPISVSFIKLNRHSVRTAEPVDLGRGRAGVWGR